MSPKANLFWLHPGRWLPLLCLVLLSYGVTDAAAANLVTITVTVTNPPTTSNTFYTVASGGTRLSIWTNATTSTTIQTNLAGINQSATNLFFHLANYPILGVTLRWLDTNQFSMRGTSLSVTSSVEWCELATNSLAGTNTYSLALPFDNLDLTHRTNQANEAVYGISTYATNSFIKTNESLAISNAAVKPIIGYQIGPTSYFRALETGPGITSSVTATSIVVSSTSGGGSLLTSNAVWVSMGGNDSTGVRGDFGHPFLTLLKAKTNAAAGDTIFVLPGVYTNNQSLLKSNVHWHFFNGTFVTNITSASALFSDSAISDMGTVSITGSGAFYDTGGSGCVSLWSNSTVSITGKILSGGNPVVGVEGPSSNLTLNEVDASSTTANCVSVDDASATLTLNRVRLTTTSSTANSPVLRFSIAANTNAILRDCVLVTNGGTNTIGHAAIYPIIRVYGWLMAKTNIGPRINFYVGTNNVTVNGDVK